jgi:hypothetical protein
LAVHLRVIEEPERCGVRAQEIPDGLVVYLHGRELEDELPLRMLNTCTETKTEPSLHTECHMFMQN